MPRRVCARPRGSVIHRANADAGSYGRPPQALEIFGGDVTPAEQEGSALEIIESKLAELERRERQEDSSQLLN
jgi:hypothetical protein